MTDKQAETGAAEAASEEDLWAEAEAAEAAGAKPEPQAEPAPEPQPEPKPAAEAAGDEPKTEPELTLSEALRLLEEERERARRMEQRVTSAEGRAVAFQRRYEEATRQREEPKAAHEEPPKDRVADGLQKIREDYPEIGEPLVAIIDDLRKQNAALSQWQQQQIEREAIQHAQHLDDEHPDWRDVTRQNADAFVAWVNAQPEDRRRQIEENAQHIKDGRAAARIISAFKAHLGSQAPKQPPAKPATPQPQTAKRARQLQGAVSTRPTGQQKFSPGVPEDADPEDIWAAIDAEERTRRAAS